MDLQEPVGFGWPESLHQTCWQLAIVFWNNWKLVFPLRPHTFMVVDAQSLGPPTEFPSPDVVDTGSLQDGVLGAPGAMCLGSQAGTGGSQAEKGESPQAPEISWLAS